MVFIGSGEDTSKNDDERYFVGQHSSGIFLYIVNNGNKNVSLLTFQFEFLREINTLYCYP